MTRRTQQARWSRKSTASVPAQWLSVSQAAALMSLTPQRIRQLREEGRFRQAMQDDASHWFFSPCCVRAEMGKTLCECSATPQNDDGKEQVDVA